MTWTDDPAWADYKAALARIAKTGARLERAQLQGSPNCRKAERAFQNALRAYERARSRLTGPAPSQSGDLAHDPDVVSLGETGVSRPEHRADRPGAGSL